MQMLGEAKCLRAMVYHDLVVMFGDIPFTFLPASQLGDNYVIPVMNREEIQINLLKICRILLLRCLLLQQQQ